MLCMLLQIVFVTCVALSTLVCARSMTVLLGQPFEYYYCRMFTNIYNKEFVTFVVLKHDLKY